MPSTKARRCEGKKAHPKRSGAQAQLWRIVRLRGAAPESYEIYLCDKCPNWHIGHNKGRRRRR